MKLFKKVIAVMAIATMSFTMTACSGLNFNSQTASQDKNGLIIARVNKVPIYKSSLDNEMAQMDYYMQAYYGQDYTSNAEVMKQYNAYKEQMVESLIEAEILVLKAKEMDSIKVTKDEVNEQLEITKANFSNEDDFNDALEKSGMTLETLKENIEKNLYVTKLLDDYAKNQVTLTDEEIEKYYNDHIANYTKKPGATISHILVDSEEKANEILDKYNGGTSFEDLAAQYGTDGTKDKGGSLGYIEYDTNQYDADFMTGAKALGEGEVSKPVKTQFGWHIIKADGIQKEEKVQSLDEVKESIKTVLQSSKAEELLRKNLEDWKKDYEITYYKENYVTEVTSTSPEASSDTSATASPEASSEAKASTNPEASTTTEASATPEANTSKEGIKDR